MIADRKVRNLRKKLADSNAHEKELEAKVLELENHLSTLVAEVDKAKEDAFNKGRREGFLAGREVGYLVGINEGREGYISLDKNQNLLVASRLQAARDFLKAPVFLVVVEIKATNFINDGFEKCKAQVATLRGFGDGFDQSRLDPSLVGNLQPYPEEKAPPNRKMNLLPY